MEVGEPEAYPLIAAPESFQAPVKKSVRRWIKHWVPHDTVLGNRKCHLLKWITEDMLAYLQTKQDNVVKQEEDPEEHEVVYLCTYEGCGKVFPESSGLRKHSQVHGEKQYICQYEGCGKRFVESSKLKRHFLIHTGEKHFICPFEGCGKAFSLDFNLRSHMRTHTGENYHICPHEDCGKRYAHEYKLKAHMRSFHSKNVPEMMPATSPAADPGAGRELVVAKYTPTPPAPPVVTEKPFSCPFEGCEKRYIHEYKLNLHLKNAHMINDRPEENFRQGRKVSQPEPEEEIEDDSDQEIFQEVVPKYYEQVPKIVEPIPAQKRRSAPKSAGKGKLLMISKPPAPLALPAPPVAKPTKRKRPDPPVPAQPELKLHIKHANVSRSAPPRQEIRQEVIVREEVVDDSEETADEGRDDTDDEDNAHTSRRMGGMMGDEDDEETEDDME